MRLLFVLTLYLFVCGAGASAAAQTGRVPYASLYRALEPGLVIERFPNLRAVQRMTSKLPDISPQQIKVRILAKSGPIEISVGPDGRVQFPMRAALLTENPQVESNQPQGSLSLSATMEIALSSGVSVPYSELFEAARQAQQALSALGPDTAVRVQGIELLFPERSQARVTIEHARGDELLLADESGLIAVRADPKLLAGNAVVRFSSVPLSVRPHLIVSR